MSTRPPPPPPPAAPATTAKLCVAEAVLAERSAYVVCGLSTTTSGCLTATPLDTSAFDIAPLFNAVVSALLPLAAADVEA